MRNVILLAFSVVLMSLCAEAQEVSKKNWTLIHERTADWCPYCGTWGWKMKDSIFSRFANDNVIFMAVHHSGGLSNNTAMEFGNNFGGVSQPVFYVDGVDIDVSSGTIDQKLDETELEVGFKSTVGVIAGVGLDARMSESLDSMWVDAKVEFLTDVTGGDYYFGLYLLEDVLHQQASLPGTPLHKQVLRQSVGPVFGDRFHTGALNQGAVFNFSKKIGLVNGKRKDYKVVGIIWTKVSNKYLFFNANMVSPATPASSGDVVTADAASLTAFQNESGQIIVRLSDSTPASNYTVMVTDMAGRVVKTREITSADGKSNISIDGNFETGIHVVTAISGSKKYSTKLMVY